MENLISRLRNKYEGMVLESKLQVVEMIIDNCKNGIQSVNDNYSMFKDYGATIGLVSLTVSAYIDSLYV